MINIQTSNLNQPLFKQNIIANWFKKILEQQCYLIFQNEIQY